MTTKNMVRQECKVSSEVDTSQEDFSKEASERRVGPFLMYLSAQRRNASLRSTRSRLRR